MRQALIAEVSEKRTRRSLLQNVLLVSGFGGILFISTFVVLGVLAPNYDPLRQTISALEFTTLSSAQRLNFFVFGLLLCTFAAALRLELAPGRGAWLIPFFQSLTGIGVIGDAIFIYEPLHLICDLIAFNSSLVVLFLFAWRFRFEGNWKGWSVYSILSAVAMMAFLAAFGFETHLGGPAGLMEKLASATRTIWSVAFTIRLFTGATFETPSTP
ncbi:MAG TPA: DUF998 domain-containing protein [Terracidiphilus sp.]|nr:DUF998 domain-containing protein [Terracidiphilus sp.]